jgi:adenosylcobinamide-GDP ribazoletransferase
MNPHVLLADVSACMVFLTRLPIRVTGLDPDRQLARSAWAFPVVGVAIGGFGGVVYAVAAAVGLTPLVAATLAVAALAAFTGALHEDGLADTVDGLGGGADAEAKLRIMRDSRLGGFGAVALILVLVGRVAALDALAQPALVAAALVAAGAVSRAVVVGVMAALDPARDDGLGAAAGKPTTDIAALAITIALVVALIVLSAGTALAVLVCVGVAGGGLAWLARRQIGGHTGDVLGAVQQVTEITTLVVAAAILGP